MARVHLPKRTIIPRNTNEEDTSANGEVKTHYANEKELDYFHNLLKLNSRTESRPYYLKKKG